MSGFDEVERYRAESKNFIDMTLLGICITFFALVATINPTLLQENVFFTLQLVLAIPFFICGLLARIKKTAYASSSRWEKLNFISFTLAYGFVINAIGLLLAVLVPIYVSMVFFGVNTMLTLVRESIAISYVPAELKKRLFRSLIHVGLIVFLGVLPALKIY